MFKLLQLEGQRHPRIMEIRLLLYVLVLLDLSICCYSYQSDTLPSITDSQFIEECVKVHNNFRASVNPRASNMFHMTWDPDLAKTAKAWAKKCLFKHNIYLKKKGQAHPTFNPVGENLWTGSLSLFSATAAITSWQSEVKYYSYTNNACSKVCGHYTQVVWDNSYKVGCAVHFCPKVEGFGGTNAAHFICNYGPAGNYGRKPYQTGRACSNCPGDICSDNLCENPERKKIIYNSGWYPEWDKPACNQYCITILVLRPSLLLLTCVAVWLLMAQYPQITINE
ncbi:PREDICTED: glioma pathogenesis-related protein 1-like [Crocodylus porosus]|nr:PREDICTED: glioma pathogenesis-related protein 1-like [Crocodylus porosus]XP_019398740.1 PREDICTED: glioma pathogenesis-related protein 1-like [Crocodylus porosus]XP_019398741.1 PREDICTED: glioma pathogenesis-related protein 1-like [Crocodylus porosus]XP_019398742.1 PREDICTED: glioma pathogenesis-related protein 1-like [Crocodylus porosus]